MAKEKKQTKWIRQQAILSAMKKVFVKSPMYKAIKDAVKEPYTAKRKDGSDSKAKRVRYLCKTCGNYYSDIKIEPKELNKNGTKKKKKVSLLQVDHISPTINPETGFIGVEDWISREFVGVEVWDPKVNTAKDLEGKLQLICLHCHNIKSAGENAYRRKIKSGET